MKTQTQAILAMIAASIFAAACGQPRDMPTGYTRTTPASGDLTPLDPNSPEATAIRYDAVEDCYKAPAFVCEVEAAIHQLTNEYRASAGLQPVAFSVHLTYSARMWSQTQAQTESISHEGFPNAREVTIVNEFGADVPVKVLAENVAQNHMKKDAATTAKEIIQQWWESPGHKANMLGDYPHLGVGIAFLGTKAYATQIFGRDSTPVPEPKPQDPVETSESDVPEEL